MKYFLHTFDRHEAANIGLREFAKSNQPCRIRHANLEVVKGDEVHLFRRIQDVRDVCAMQVYCFDRVDCHATIDLDFYSILQTRVRPFHG